MTKFVNIHTHRPSGRGIELSTAGIHPWDAGRESVQQLEARLNGAQAIGETGLDFASDADRTAQMEAFRAQLALACTRNLPVVLHCVRAFGEVMHELAACQPRAVIFHGFIGSPEQAAEALKKGYYLSFGERAFSSPKTLAAMRRTPLDRIFFETDDSPTPIEAIYSRAAEALGTTTKALQRATAENYEALFAKA